MNNQRTSAIYVLYDTRDNEPRYVGRTMQQLKLRRRTHVAEGRHTHLPCHRDLWIRDVENDGGSIGIREIDRVPVFEAAERERWWIERLASEGAELVNTKYHRQSAYHLRQLQTTRVSHPGCGLEFRSMRQELGMSRAAMGEYLDVSPNTIYQWERERVTIRREAWSRVKDDVEAMRERKTTPGPTATGRYARSQKRATA